MDRDEQLRRIAYFEAILDALTRLSADPEADAAALRAAEGPAKELEAYYTGADWKRDFADDEAGLLPKELRRGVLSEDGIWDALEAYRARLAELPDELPPRFAALGRVSLLGRGSTGTVYRIEGEKTYALKVVDCGADAEKHRLAEHEIALMRRLAGRERAVRLLDSELVERAGKSVFYLLEEYCEPLPVFLAENPLTAEGALRLAAGLCEAWLDCRAAGVLHLDIQPKNLFLDERGEVRLGDFSSSLTEEELGRERRRRGTPAYLAPEVYREGRCSERSEICSAGLLLYTLLNGGRPPFADREPKEPAIYKRLAGTPLPPLSLGDAELDEALSALLRGACAFRPEDRFKNMETLLDLLLRLRDWLLETPAAQRIVLSSTIDPRETSIAIPQGIDPRETSVAIPQGIDPRETSIAIRDGGDTLTDGDWQSERNGVEDDTLTISDNPLPGVSFEPEGEEGILYNRIDTDPPGGILFQPGWGEDDWAAEEPEHPGPVCPSCGMEAPKDALFCPFCGGRLRPASAPELTQVEFSAVAPKALAKGEDATVRFVMYEESSRRVVDALLARLGDAGQEEPGSAARVSEGTRVELRVRSQDLEIEDEVETQIWRGKHLVFDFTVRLPEDCRKEKVRLTASVYFDGVFATRLNCGMACSPSAAPSVELERRDVKSAFISYASADRRRVAAMVQGMKKVRGDLDVFFDVLSLRKKEWERELYAEIDRRDVLYLCWSRNARDSEWVDREWRYALQRKGEDGIEPLPVELPEFCAPPAELRGMNWNNLLLYIINAPEPPEDPDDDPFDK